MMNEEIRNYIREKLKQLEKEHNVTILQVADAARLEKSGSFRYNYL